ncbi:glycogen debranching protein GlgX [Myxococcota bacterium]|nr:glycogen debranching protein GlgX [Myxococcota bacterium]MBU1498127.1 glycogen debranching protein GlgX [Myxococcota bacterium]
MLIEPEKRRIRLRQAPPFPMGASHHYGGTRFVVFSRHATAVSLLFFDNANDVNPSKEWKLSPDLHRFGDIWSCFIEGSREGQIYAWKMDGDEVIDGIKSFTPEAFLIDPYTKAICGPYEWRDGLGSRDIPTAPKSVVTSPVYNWKRTISPKIPMEKTVIYEVHLRGYSAHPSAQVDFPGTFAGFIEKIKWIKELGITTVELLPIQAFAENEVINRNPFTGERLKNYWGYSTMAFMAVHPPYGALPGEEKEEFSQFVRTLHDNGLEVILDIVFNHTAEGNQTGPVLSFRGLDNSIYYMMDTENKCYLNYSGCGNTLNCNHPVVRDFIMDVLRYWVVEMGVDGFRFDLASILGRDQDGNLLDNPPLVERIAEDPILRNVKIIAEAWDAGGAYQVGSFPGTRWAEWNGRFRDDIRAFWLTEGGSIADFATRLAGSEDLYGSSGRTPLHSINFVASHDGFSLRDLVSYDYKHNEINGENNRDGDNHNLSDNHGIEGYTHDHEIRNLRLRQMKNLLLTLFVSQGVPMIYSGDEYGHTKLGNNNTYCQDNPVTWFDWRLTGNSLVDEFTVSGFADPLDVDIEEGRHITDFIRNLISFRNNHPHLRRKTFFSGSIVKNSPSPFSGMRDIMWINEKMEEIDWSYPRKFIGVILGPVIENDCVNLPVQMYFNATDEDIVAVIRSIPGYRWKIMFDTSDMRISDNSDRILEDTIITVKSRSSVVASLVKV